MKDASDSRETRENQEPKAPERNLEESGINGNWRIGNSRKPDKPKTKTTIEDVEDEEDSRIGHSRNGKTSKDNSSKIAELPFMNVPPQTVPSSSQIPINQPSKKSTSFNDAPKFKKMAPVEEKVSVDDEAAKIMDQVVQLPLNVLAAMSPALREKIRLHMTRRRVDPSAFLAEVQKLEMGDYADLHKEFSSLEIDEVLRAVQFRYRRLSADALTLRFRRSTFGYPRNTRNGAPQSELGHW